MDRPKPKTSSEFNLGDRVRIKHYAGGPGRIVELRGPLGPGGALVYRVLLRRKPVPAHVEVLGSQLEAIEAVDSHQASVGER